MEYDTGRYTCTHSTYQDPIYVSVNVTVFKPGNFAFYFIGKTEFNAKLSCMYLIRKCGF